MPNIRDVVAMLEDSGSTKLYASNGHIKYRLPNGNTFVTSGTPGDQRSYTNALSQLRRQLRVTHPEIADRHRSLPKNKRHTSNTLGELMTLKGIANIIQPISGFSAVPGSQPTEADFQIIQPEISQPEPEPEPLRRHSFPTTRKRHDPPPPPSKPKTLSTQQLNEANIILRSQGESAMNCYINQCRNGLVDVSRELLAERSPEPIIAPQNRVPEVRHTEEDEMSNVLERARTELQTTNSRLESYTAQMNELKAKQEDDVLRQTQLEEYIAKHEALVSEATKLLTEILPPEPVTPPPPAPQKKSYRPRSQELPALAFGMRDIETRVFPVLRERGVEEFDMVLLMSAIADAKFGGPTPKRSQIQSWLYSYLNKKECVLAKGGPGKFTFKPTYQHIPHESPVEAHA